MPEPTRLRVALLTYRGHPYSGGQGVYVRHLARALTQQGHYVEVFSGQPYPHLEPGTAFTPVPGLDLYRPSDPYRFPAVSEFKDWTDILEFRLMMTGRFSEPLAFSHRARRLLRDRVADFDVVHDNQGFGYGVREMLRDGHTVVGTIHHPVAVDRRLSGRLAADEQRHQASELWYQFTRMQEAVARTLFPLVAVSRSSARDAVTHMGIPPDALRVVPLGVDHEVFRPLRSVARVPGRVVAMAGAGIPMKGLDHLLDAMSRLVARGLDCSLTVVSRPWEDTEVPGRITALGLDGRVRLLTQVPEDELVRLYAEAEVAVVPSLYEGFSLPAAQAMACELPLVATTAGALPEVVGRDGDAGLTVPPGDPTALAAAVERLLGDAELRARLGAAGRRRALSRFTWERCAVGTVAAYHEALARRDTRRAAAV